MGSLVITIAILTQNVNDGGSCIEAVFSSSNSSYSFYHRPKLL